MSKVNVSSNRKQGNSPLRVRKEKASNIKSLSKIQYYSSSTKNIPQEVLKLVSNVFKVVAIEESDIERLRQVFAHMKEFTYNQEKLFKVFDQDGDNNIAAQELLEFMNDSYIKGATLEDCVKIISEFDSTGDGMLNFDEFLNIFLPAADYNIRNQDSTGPHSRSDNELPSSVCSMAARILEKEKAFIQKKNSARDALKNESDATLALIFHLISKGKTEIKNEDLIQFLDQQGFYAKKEELEAILRRFDHDADGILSLEEFGEILGREFDKLFAEREKLLELVDQQRKEELERIKKQQELIKAEFQRKKEAEREKQQKDTQSRQGQVNFEREFRGAQDTQRNQQSRRIENESQSGWNQKNTQHQEIQYRQTNGEQTLSLPISPINHQYVEKERFIQNGRVEISGSFNIKEYERKIINEQNDYEKQKQLDKWRSEKEQELEKVNAQFEQRKYEIERELEIQRIENERRVHEERIEQERQDLEKQRQYQIWQQEKKKESQKQYIEQESRKKEIQIQQQIDKYERESKLAEEKEIVQEQILRQSHRHTHVHDEQYDQSRLYDEEREYVQERRQKYVAPAKQYVKQRIVRRVISPAPQIQYVPIQQIQQVPVQQVVRRVRQEPAVAKRVVSAAERNIYRGKSVERKETEQKVERAKIEEEKKVQIEEWKIKRQQQVEQAKIEQEIKKQELEQQIQNEKIERELKITELREESERIKIEKEHELETIRLEKEQELEKAKIEYEAKVRELEVEKEKIALETEKQKQEVLNQIEIKRQQIYEMLEEERIQREEDHIAWKIEQDRIRLEKEREEEWIRLQKEEELEEQRKQEEFDKVEQEKQSIIQKIDREKMMEEYKIKKLADEAEKAKQLSVATIERTRRIEEVKIENEKIRIERESKVLITRLQSGQNIKKIDLIPGAIKETEIRSSNQYEYQNQTQEVKNETIQEESQEMTASDEYEEIVEYVQPTYYQNQFQAKQVAPAYNNAYWIEEYKTVPQHQHYEYAQQPLYQTQVIQQPISYAQRVITPEVGLRTVSQERRVIQGDRHFDHRRVASSGHSAINAARILNKSPSRHPTKYTKIIRNQYDDSSNYFNEPTEYQQTYY